MREGARIDFVQASTGEPVRSVKGAELPSGVVKRKPGEARTRPVVSEKLGGGRFASELAEFKSGSASVGSRKENLARLEALFPSRNKPEKETGE